MTSPELSLDDAQTRPPSFASLRARLLLLVTVALAPAFALTLWNHYQHLLDQRAGTRAAASRIAHSRAFEFAEKIEDTKSLLAIIAGLPSVRDNPHQQHCTEVIAGMKRALPLYGNLGVASSDGRMACSAAPFDLANPPNVSDRLWFRRALENRAFAIGDYLVGRLTGLHSITFSYPVADTNGDLVGVAFAALDLSWLSRFVTGLPLPPDSALVVIDESGRILARHPDHAAWVGKPHPRAARILAASTAAEEGTLDEVVGADNVQRLSAWARVPGSTLTVVYGLPQATAEAEARHEFTRDLGFMTVNLLLGFALAWITAELIVLRRTRRLSGMAVQLANGDLAARSGISSADEIGRLAAAFDRMAAAVAEREHRLARANRALRVLSASNRALLGARSEPELLDTVCRIATTTGGYHMARITIDGHQIAMGTMMEPEVDVSISLPLRLNGEEKGALELHAAANDAFDVQEIELLTEMADDLAFGIGMLHLRKQKEQVDAELHALNADLERRVAGRTAELENANAALARASELKSDFLASMSHELRTPLNAIIGFSEVLRDGFAGPLTPQQRDCLQDILNGGTHLLALINDILDLSKVEAGKMTLDLETLPVASALHMALSIVRDKATAHRLKLELDIAADAGEIVADARKVKQIVYNLLSNAVKFTPDGGRIVVSARRVATDTVPHATPPPETTAFLEIAVADTGIGIAPEDQARLFSAFTQIDSSLARQYEGTGLGLALLKRLAELHGGAVGLASAPGQGSTFRVWLPYRPHPLISETPTPHPEDIPS